MKLPSPSLNETRQANEAAIGFREAARCIDEIVKAIGSVASRTSMLALNATIEAARAGDAGHSFAVVAGEVKAFARQAAAAAVDIACHIKRMQDATVSMADTIGRVAGSAKDIDQRNASAAAASSEATSVAICISGSPPIPPRPAANL